MAAQGSGESSQGVQCLARGMPDISLAGGVEGIWCSVSDFFDLQGDGKR